MCSVAFVCAPFSCSKHSMKTPSKMQMQQVNRLQTQTNTSGISKERFGNLRLSLSLIYRVLHIPFMNIKKRREEKTFIRYTETLGIVKASHPFRLNYLQLPCFVIWTSHRVSFHTGPGNTGTQLTQREKERVSVCNRSIISLSRYYLPQSKGALEQANVRHGTMFDIISIWKPIMTRGRVEPVGW